MRVYVDPACPLRVRFGGDSHPECHPSFRVVWDLRKLTHSQNPWPWEMAFRRTWVQLRSTLPIRALTFFVALCVLCDKVVMCFNPQGTDSCLRVRSIPVGQSRDDFRERCCCNDCSVPGVDDYVAMGCFVVLTHHAELQNNPNCPPCRIVPFPQLVHATRHQ